MRNLSLKGIILKKRNIGEHDQYITLYCSELGKIEAIAKGSRKSGSSFTGHLEIPNICRFQIYQSSRNLIITECKTITSFKALYHDFDKALVAMLLVEMFEKALSFHQVERNIFELLQESIMYLSQNHNAFVCVESFKLKLLEFLGIFPNLSECSKCQKKWTDEEDFYLDHNQHLHCKICKKSPFGYQKIAPRIIQLIHSLKNEDLEKINNFQFNTEEKKILYHLSNHFVQTYLQQELKTERVLKACIRRSTIAAKN